MCRSRIKDLFAMLGNKRLVGGNNMLSLLDCLQDECSCRFNAADQFNHNIYFRIVEYIIHVLGEFDMGQVFGQFRDVNISDPLEDDCRTDFFCQTFRLIIEYLGCAAADSAESDQSNLYLLHYFLFL